jgi:hypothetical protein
MKKLILSAMLAAFAVAVQAGEDKAACCSEKQATQASSCCSKTAASEQAKGECPMMAKQAKASSCPYVAKSSTKETKNKSALQSPKALADARK